MNFELAHVVDQAGILLGEAGAGLASGTIIPTGIQAPIGTLYIQTTNAKWYKKTGPGVNDWQEQVISGLTESQHEALDTLVHGIAEDCHYVPTYDGTYTWRINKKTYWTDATLTTKIREITYTYDPTYIWRISQSVIQQYNAGGTVKTTYTGTYVYYPAVIWKLNYVNWVVT